MACNLSSYICSDKHVSMHSLRIQRGATDRITKKYTRLPYFVILLLSFYAEFATQQILQREAITYTGVIND